MNEMLMVDGGSGCGFFTFYCWFIIILAVIVEVNWVQILSNCRLFGLIVEGFSVSAVGTIIFRGGGIMVGL